MSLLLSASASTVSSLQLKCYECDSGDPLGAAYNSRCSVEGEISRTYIRATPCSSPCYSRVNKAPAGCKYRVFTKYIEVWLTTSKLPFTFTSKVLVGYLKTRTGDIRLLVARFVFSMHVWNRSRRLVLIARYYYIHWCRSCKEVVFAQSLYYLYVQQTFILTFSSFLGFSHIVFVFEGVFFDAKCHPFNAVFSCKAWLRDGPGETVPEWCGPHTRLSSQSGRGMVLLHQEQLQQEGHGELHHRWIALKLL